MSHTASTKLFTDSEFIALVAAMQLRPGGPCSQEEFDGFMDWAYEVRRNAVLLDRRLGEQLVLSGFGEGRPRFVGDELTTTNPVVIRATARFERPEGGTSLPTCKWNR